MIYWTCLVKYPLYLFQDLLHVLLTLGKILKNSFTSLIYWGAIILWMNHWGNTFWQKKKSDLLLFFFLSLAGLRQLWDMHHSSSHPTASAIYIFSQSRSHHALPAQIKQGWRVSKFNFVRVSQENSNKIDFLHSGNLGKIKITVTWCLLLKL